MTTGPREFGPEEELRIRAQVKAELRARMRAIRGQLSPEARAARSASIIANVVALPEYGRAHAVAAFFPLRGEVDLRPLFERVIDDGKILALPRVDLEANEIVLARFVPGAALEEGPYGVREPAADAEVLAADAVDFVLCPALALDEAGHRIGYGGGYYDRLLPRCARAFACGVAFDFQLISEAPVMPGDVPVGAVITDARVVRVEPA